VFQIPSTDSSHSCILRHDLVLVGFSVSFVSLFFFLADRTNGHAYATVLCLSVVCNVMYCG